MLVSSCSVLDITRNIVRIEDGEIITFWADGYEIRKVEGGSLVERQPELVEESMDAVQKGGYAHFMLKEIHEQAQVAQELFHLLEKSADIEPMIARLNTARNIYIIACGTSYHAGLLGSVYFSRLAGRATIPALTGLPWM